MGVARHESDMDMRIEFPDLKGKEKKTLFIIGNGFDLYHGIPSQYRHFRSWLEGNRHENFVDEMEDIFPKLNECKKGLWNNFENALQDYDLECLYKTLHTENHDQWTPDIWKQTAERLEMTTGEIRPLMKEWAKSIDIKKICSDSNLMLREESLYLTFNYTKILEEFYHIPNGRICHIHGSIDDNDVITGHIRWQRPDDYRAQKDEKEVVCRECLRVLNKLNKDTEKQINKHRDFFTLIKDVTCVVVLGHSMGGIDMAYFREVLNRVRQECHWHFSKHDVEDDKMIQQFIKSSQENCSKNKIQTTNSWIFNF